MHVFAPTAWNPQFGDVENNELDHPSPGASCPALRCS